MSVRTCTVSCPCGPNREPLRCGYKPGHKGGHSWATLPTFVRPHNDGGGLFIQTRGALEPLEVIASREWWSAVCSSLGEDYPHVATIRKALAAPVSSSGDQTGDQT